MHLRNTLCLMVIHKIICNLVACLVLLLLHVSGNANASELRCIVSIKVPRNTLVEALVMTEFKINCTVNALNCQGIPKISWCKLYGEDCKASNQSNYIQTVEWMNITHGIAFLTFLNISMEDAGLYRCKSQNTVSHSINVTVIANIKDDRIAHSQNNTNSTIQHVKNPMGFWYYVSICRWAVGLTVILTGVSLIIIRDKSMNDKDENKGMITTALEPSCLVPNGDDPQSNISSNVSISSVSIYANIEHL